MCASVDFTKNISIEEQLEIKKIIFLQKYSNTSEISITSINNKNLPGLENSNKYDNCSSLYVKDFEIFQITKNKIKPKVCIFSSLPENNLNPFQTYAKLNNLYQKRIIDLRNLKDTEEPNFLLLNDIFSQ